MQEKRTKQLWLEFIEAFKEMKLLWDPSDEHRHNKYLRSEANEKLLEKYYKKIDENATVEDMKNRINNMRTTFKREAKKVRDCLINGETYKPTLWYFDIFNSFIESEAEGSFDTLKHFKDNLSIQRPSRSERQSLRLSERNRNGSVKEEEDEEEETESPEPAQKKRRIYNLLQKQERFVDSAHQILARKEEDWEIHGKAIALQLCELTGKQRTIAKKLISDAIFYGSLGKLTEESFLNLNHRQPSPEIHEQIDYLEEEFTDNEDE